MQNDALPDQNRRDPKHPEGQETELPDFQGKVVLLYLSNPPQTLDAGTLLEYVEFRRFGSKLFLVGRVPEVDDSQWVSRLQSGVAWDSVVNYFIFDSHEDYKLRMSLGRPNLLRRLLRAV